MAPEPGGRVEAGQRSTRPEPLLLALARDTRLGRTRVLQAPPGAELGRLLDQLAARLGPGLQVAHLAGSLGEPEAIAGRALEAVTGALPADPLFAFDAYLLHLAETAGVLVLLIDDVGALPASTALWLRERLDAARGSLRLVAAAADGSVAQRVAAQLGVSLGLPAPSFFPPLFPPGPRRNWVRRVVLVGLLAVGGALLAWGLWSASGTASESRREASR